MSIQRSTLSPPTLYERHPIIDDAMAQWKATVGGDWQAYRNHAYRVYNFSRAQYDTDSAAEGFAVASAFHDLGIWPERTFDYLETSAHR